jgi:hypothetical protein
MCRCWMYLCFAEGLQEEGLYSIALFVSFIPGQVRFRRMGWGGVYIGLIQFTGGLGIETWDGGWIGASITQSYGFEEL